MRWRPPSLALAEMQLEDDAAMRAYVERVRSERRELGAVLERLGAQPLPTQGNFVLCRPADPGGLVRELAARGIAVRTWPSHALLKDFVRISCPGDADDMQRLSRALEEVLS